LWDSEFYYESGDCTICVGGTLFKVGITTSSGRDLICEQIHRFILIRDSPVFAGLFALPQGPDPTVEGSCDELPIYLIGDPEESFRSLFRYIYALSVANCLHNADTLTLGQRALETQATRIPITNLQDVLAVAHLAHKYEMMTWETWAFLVIGNLIEQHPMSLSSPDLVAIYRLCHGSFAGNLGAKTAAQWLERIMRNELPISDALNAAETSQDRRFLALLYKIQHIPTTTGMFHHYERNGLLLN
jgi:hypothetical protein